MSTPSTKPVTEIKRHATEIIARLKDDQVPVLITEHGRSAPVLLDVATNDSLCPRIALLEGITRGERAFAYGRIGSHRTAKQRLARWLRPRR